MSMWRDTTTLDLLDMPLTAAERVWVRFMDDSATDAIIDRAWWEAGYESGFYNARYGSQVFDTLRSNEQQIADLQERVAELRYNLDCANEELGTRLAAIMGLTAELKQARQYDREALAAVQHEIWAHWMKYQFSRGYFRNMELEGKLQQTWVMPVECILRWERQMKTPYSELSEQERESDRHQADKVIAILNKETNEQ